MTKKYKYPWLTGTIILIIVLLSALPTILEPVVTTVIRKQGVDATGIHNIDINYFSGELLIEGLSIANDGAAQFDLPRLRIDLDWSRLVRGVIAIDTLEMDGLLLRVNQNKTSMQIAGFDIPQSDAPPQPQPQQKSVKKKTSIPPLAIRMIELKNIQILHSDANRSNELLLTRIVIEDVDSTRPQQALKFLLDVAVNKATVTAKGSTHVFTPEPDVDVTLSLKDLQLAPYNYLMPEMKIAGAVASSHQIKATYLKSGALHFSHQGKITLADSDITLKQMNNERVSGHDITLQADLDGEVQEGDLRLNIDNELTLQQFKAQIPLQNISASLKALKWKGKTQLTKQGDSLQPQVNGSLAIEDIKATQTKTKLLIAVIKSIDVEEFQLNPQSQIAIANVKIAGVEALKPKDVNTALYRLVQVMVEKVNVDPDKGLSIHQITLDSNKLNIVTDENRSIAAVKQLQSSEKKPPAKTSAVKKEAKTDEKPYPILIKKIVMTGESGLYLLDKGVKPQYETELKLNKVVIENINNSHKENQTSYMLQGEMGQYGKIDLNGHVAPFTDEIELKLQGELDQIELQPFTPYVEPAIGYKLTSGMAFVSIKMDIIKSEMDGHINMDIRKLELEPGDEEKVQKFSKQLSMPLPTALLLLRKDDDSINLEFPVKGNVNDPDININDVINTALGKAFKTGSVFYLKQLLQPYSGIIFLAGLANDLLSGISLEAIIFEFEQNQLEDEQKDYLNKIAKLLTERKVELKVCGYYSQSEKQLLAEKLNAKKDKKKQATEEELKLTLDKLATDRAELIKSYLVEQGTDSSRLFICLPQFDKDEKAQSRVEVLL